MKKHLTRLPYVGYEPYDDSSMEFAFVIQIYDALFDGHYEGWEELTDTGYLKGAIAVAKSLTLNTDVIERKIPIFFHVEDCIYDKHLTYFLNAGIKRERIRCFNSFDAPDGATPINKYRVSKSFYLMNDPVISQYDSYCKWDADLFACCKPELGQKLSTHWLQGTELGALDFHQDGISNEDIKSKHWFDKWTGTRDTHDENFETTRQNIIEVFDRDLLTEDSFPLSGALCGIMRFPRELPDGFKTFATTLEPVVGDEELILALWVKHCNSWVRGLNPQPMCWDSNQISQLRERGAYFLHVGCRSEVMEDWEHVFRHDIGAQETGKVVARPVESNAIRPQIAYLNIDRRTDRKEAFLRGIETSGYIGKLLRVSGIDKQHYKSHADLVKAGSVDFHSFEPLIHTTSDDAQPWIAHQWAYLRCLEYIASQNHHILLFEDDMILAKLWSDTLVALHQLPPNYKIALLNYNHDPDSHNDIPEYNDIWYQGAKANGTTATVFSPKGAEMLRDMVVETIDVSAEVHVWRNQIPDVYSIKATTDWVWTNQGQGESDCSPHHDALYAKT